MSRLFPSIFAIVVGFATLIGLFIAPNLGQIMLNWGSLLAAFALLMGIINLMRVHLNRASTERNLYSLVLVLSMWAIFFLSLTDWLGLTNNTVAEIFTYVQAPLEGAFASLIAVLLLVAGFNMLKHQRSVWTVLFLLAAVLVLLSTIALTAFGTLFLEIRYWLEAIVVTAGMRGILIGVALGSVMIAIRLLLGIDQPYNK
ncbi:MAG: hypothetical protein KDE51_21220 [Anaerolineales bacterium]|nr:hypothetical protein [Anaerolineales bacterium]